MRTIERGRHLYSLFVGVVLLSVAASCTTGCAQKRVDRVNLAYLAPPREGQGVPVRIELPTETTSGSTIKAKIILSSGEDREKYAYVLYSNEDLIDEPVFRGGKIDANDTEIEFDIKTRGSGLLSAIVLVEDEFGVDVVRIMDEEPKKAAKVALARAPGVPVRIQMLPDSIVPIGRYALVYVELQTEPNVNETFYVEYVLNENLLVAANTDDTFQIPAGRKWGTFNIKAGNTAGFVKFRVTDPSGDYSRTGTMFITSQ